MVIFLLIVSMLLIFIYLAIKFGNLSEQNNLLIKKTEKVEHELDNIKKLISGLGVAQEDSTPEISYMVSETIPKPSEYKQQEEEKAPEPEKVEENFSAPQGHEERQESEEPAHEVSELSGDHHIQEEIAPVHYYDHYEEETVQKPVGILQNQAVHKPSIFDNLDWEKFIGENLINKIGIGILVLGIGFFVKYAIDKDWINEIGRVFIGIISGGTLVVLAHKLRKEYKAFSSVLIGGGLSVFYFTIAIAFHEYHLLSQITAFLVMIMITAFAIFLSIAYNRQELAVLAIIGGFTTPFLVSTGEGNYIVLFSYLLILNTGMLVLAYFRKWSIVNIVSYVFTVILYTGWLSTQVVGVKDSPQMGALVFASLFYLEFFLMNIIHNLRENKSFKALDFSILLSNTFMYYAAGMVVLDQIHDGIFKGLFTVLLAAFNFGFAFTLLRNSRVDRNLVYLLIGLVLTFISLAAPVQLEGNWITMFWALEGVLLLWLAKKSGIYLIKISSLVVNTLMVISLLMDWNQLYGLYSAGKDLPVLINKAFITSAISLGALTITRQILKSEEEEFFTKIVSLKYYRLILNVLLLTGAYFALYLELNYQLYRFVELQLAIYMYLGIYHFLWLLGLTYYLRKYNGFVSQTLVPCIAGLSIVLYLFNYQSMAVSLRDVYLTSDLVQGFLPFLSHYIINAIFVTILVFALKQVNLEYGFRSGFGIFCLWISAFVVIFISSAELDHLVVLLSYTEVSDLYSVLQDTRRIGYPIIWGLCSFAFMLLGIKKKLRQLRIISLSTFFIILLKLFLFDVNRMPEGGKILAFIILGLLLLTVSFLYQKLKKLLSDDDLPSEGQVQTPLT